MAQGKSKVQQPSSSDPQQPLVPRELPSVPQHPGDAPFRNLLALPEAQPGFLAEAKREIQSSAVRQLEALEEAYRSLVQQAQGIVQTAQRDLQLHDIPVNATKIRGRCYHLYQGTDQRRPLFFSILSPEEYATADATAHHLASYRLNEDSTWSRLDEGTEEPWIRLPAGEGDARR